MLHPSYNDLMNVVNRDVEPGEHPVVKSRYSIVLATAKRARQLIDGSEPLVEGNFPKPLSVAIEELSTSAIKINSEEDEVEEDITVAANNEDDVVQTEETEASESTEEAEETEDSEE